MVFNFTQLHALCYRRVKRKVLYDCGLAVIIGKWKERHKVGAVSDLEEGVEEQRDSQSHTISEDQK